LIVVSLNILQRRDDIFLSALKKQIVDCTLCPRLLSYSTNIGRIKPNVLSASNIGQDRCQASETQEPRY